MPLPYWSNTSSNSIVKELLKRVDRKVQKDLNALYQATLNDEMEDPVISLEFKVAKSLAHLEDAVEQGLRQIVEKEYIEGVYAQGYKKADCL